MKFGFQRRTTTVVIPDPDPILSLGRATTSEYRRKPVRLFNEALLRAHSLMRTTQGKRTRVWLPVSFFPLERFEESHVYMHHAQDDSHAEVRCEDRSLLVYPVNPRIMALCPHTHGGKFLGLALIYTFLAGK